MKTARWIVIVVALLVLGTLAYVVLTGRTPGGKTGPRLPNQVAREFLEVLPADLTEAQRAEIAGLLETFYARAGDGKVAIEDRQTIENKLRKYVQQGEIARGELNVFMAEVSQAAYRLDPDFSPPDSTGIHPLLLPAADSSKTAP